MTSNPLIKIKNLDFGYEKNLILENVNLTIFQGEFIGIFGPNGGGKTTFLKLLMGFLKPNRGEIALFDTEPKFARPYIGYVPQGASFDKQFPLSVLELVLMGCLSEAYWWGGYAKNAKQKAQQALETVGLLDKQQTAFGKLSGGQMQRALIARALVQDPSLLLLDEPTANVDPEAGKEIYACLSALKGKITILLVTHDLEGILNKSGRLLCIHRTATFLSSQQICEHYSLGLYHSKGK